MTAARHAAILAPSPEIGDTIASALELAGYVVTLLSASEIESRSGRSDLELALGELIVNEPDILVSGSCLFPVLQDPDRSLTVGLRTTFAFCKIAVRTMMRKRFGRIIAIAPSTEIVHLPSAAAVCGLGGLMKSIAREVGSRGITANVIAPGHLATGDGELSPYVAVGRATLPSDIAAAVHFLLSPEAGDITGQVINVDGGLAAA